MENELYAKFEIEFYRSSDVWEEEVKLVKTVKKTGYKSDVEFYAQEQIDMGNYDSYIVRYAGNLPRKNRR